MKSGSQVRVPLFLLSWDWSRGELSASCKGFGFRPPAAHSFLPLTVDPFLDGQRLVLLVDAGGGVGHGSVGAEVPARPVVLGPGLLDSSAGVESLLFRACVRAGAILRLSGRFVNFSALL